jgi:aspartate/methionine/tyrosine aminotransferase
VDCIRAQIGYLRGKGKEETEALFHELAKQDVLVVPGYCFDCSGKADPVRHTTTTTTSEGDRSFQRHQSHAVHSGTDVKD